MRWQDHIEFNPKVMVGKPVIKGTRITVELLLERLGSGWSDEQIIEAFPRVTRDDIRAAQTYASQAISTDSIFFLREAG